VKKFNLPKLDDVFTSISDKESTGDRGSPGNEDNHYRGEVQPIDLIEAQNLNFAEGNIVKLVCRYKDKAGLLDLGKIVYYTYRLIHQWLVQHPEDAERFKW
jgi:hypothetical protein